MNGPSRTLTALLMLLVVLLLCGGAGFAGYQYGHYEGYVVGQKEGSSASYNQGLEEGQQKGYTAGYAEGQRIGTQVAPTGIKKGSPTAFNRHNPTYQEVRDFLKNDRTNYKHYVKDQYVCSDYAAEANNNAEALGIRCAVVELRYPNDYAHALIAFDTTDRGMIYFEPQFDTEVIIAVGQSYSQTNHYEVPAQDDTILRILVMW